MFKDLQTTSPGRQIHALRLTNVFREVSPSCSSSTNFHEANVAKYSQTRKHKEGNLQKTGGGIKKYSARGLENEKFRKRRNKIEANKEDILRSTLRENKKNNLRGMFSRGQKQMKHTTFSSNRRISCTTRDRFIPRKLADFQLAEIFQTQKQDGPTADILQGVLLRQDLKSQRSLFGHNILSLQQKYNFSRFQLHNLHSVYQVLLRYSKGSISRFQSGFQVILNMNRVNVRMDVIAQIFEELQKLDFNQFINMYSKIDSMIFRQNIIDYLNIMFQNIRDRDYIRYDDILKVFRIRVSEIEAHELTRFIFQKSDKPEDGSLMIKELYRLCQTCQQFTKKMFKLYTKQIKCD